MTTPRIFDSDGRSSRDGLIHRLDPRARTIVAILFALTTLLHESLSILCTLLAASFALALLARLPVIPTAKRLLALDAFMAVVLVTLPFTITGTTVWQIGPVSASWEGIFRVAEIVIKANAVVLSVLALVGTLEAVALGHALAWLGLPMKIVQLLLLTVRYVGILRDQFVTMRMAMRVRAFRPGFTWHTWQSFGWLFGMLLVRSAERAERVRDAMKCRGYRGEFHLVTDLQIQTVDWIFGGLAVLFLSTITFWGLSL